jgi:hypothetical protein
MGGGVLGFQLVTRLAMIACSTGAPRTGPYERTSAIKYPVRRELQYQDASVHFFLTLVAPSMLRRPPRSLLSSAVY